jgi:hypothetical protein
LVSASPDLLRTMLTTFINTLMSAEADAICGAPYGQLSPERTNGSKSCVWHAAATASRLTCRVMQVQRRRDAPAPLSTGCPTSPACKIVGGPLSSPGGSPGRRGCGPRQRGGRGSGASRPSRADDSGDDNADDNRAPTAHCEAGSRR